MSSVFDVPGNNFMIHHNKGNTPTSYLVDKDGQPLMKFAIKYDGNGYYRSNFKTSNEINKMLTYI